MNTDIHRLLDEAFAGIDMTPDAQDLKEEMRANLIARVDELEAAGHEPLAAARAAIAEIGDVRELLGEADAAGSRDPLHEAYLRHRVKPKTGFVVRVVVWSLAAVVGIVLAVLGATGILPLPAGPMIAFVSIAATGLGMIVGDSLAQETTTNHPMPANRAALYALATFLGALGLGFAGLAGFGALPVWNVVFAALGVIASIILFAFLAASQTNRHKAWTRRLQGAIPPNRFEEDPETAARFGIYTAVIWTVTFAVIVVLALTVGWWWGLLAFVGGFAAMMLILARMMFGPRRAGD